MDLVNLLSYKKEFVFEGNDRVVANLLTEHTIQVMCGKEGQAVREKKRQTQNDVFHRRMVVVQLFFEKFAAHLRGLGFHHLRLASTRLKLEDQSHSRSPTLPEASHLTTVDAVAAEGEAFSEHFVLASSGSRRRRCPAQLREDELVVLQLKCDPDGLQLSANLVSESDLASQMLSMYDVPKGRPTRGDAVSAIATALRSTLNTRSLIHDFTINFFQECLQEWVTYATKLSSSSSSRVRATHPMHHNLVKGVKCFLRACPHGKGSSRAVGSTELECSLATSMVELPIRNLQSNCAESILVKILLRYIASHSARYEVTDLTQFGTPDTLACHSAVGNFFNRHQAPGSQVRSSSKRSGDGRSGYSLLITTQELWRHKRRPKHAILLVLLRTSSATLGIGNSLFPMDRALVEAQEFVNEMFRAAAANYERDLLWSRLLYTDGQGVAADVAHRLGFPLDQFHVDVGPQQLEECLRLSVCTPLERVDPSLSALLGHRRCVLAGVCASGASGVCRSSARVSV
ncbi:hypothetical protein PINS_up008779 [Pythium insidiosum]|nr:hypothetical protein PINS_up008779 [Pythium insidiosum]